MPQAEKKLSEKWLWYTSRTPRGVPLDPRAYPSAVFDREVIPWPDWACKAPDGGVHIDARIGAIDVHLAKAPSSRDEISWTRGFQVRLVSSEWLAQIEDLIDGRNVARGQVFVDGRALTDWATIHEAHATRLFSDDERSKVCPICGDLYAVLYGKTFFVDPAVQGRRLIVTSNGIFVREDEAIRRRLRTPAGAYKPSLVGLRRGGPTAQ